MLSTAEWHEAAIPVLSCATRSTAPTKNTCWSNFLFLNKKLPLFSRTKCNFPPNTTANSPIREIFTQENLTSNISTAPRWHGNRSYSEGLSAISPMNVSPKQGGMTRNIPEWDSLSWRSTEGIPQAIAINGSNVYLEGNSSKLHMARCPTVLVCRVLTVSFQVDFSNT